MNSTGFDPVTRELAMRKRLQEAVLVFSKGVSAHLALGTGLEALAREVNVLFGTTRAAVWLHDRRARTLRLAGSSDVRDAGAPCIGTDENSVIARGLRQDGPQIAGSGDAQTLTIPLRGWRRALGTLVLEGHPRAVDGGQFVDLAMDLARQLSGAIESVLVLEELIRQHRTLEDTFDSLADMVIVVDKSNRTLRVNSALSTRIGAKRSELLDQPLEQIVGPAITRWVESTGSERGEIATREFKGERLAAALAATSTPFVSHTGGRVGQVLVLRDISDQVRLRERVAQAEKLASLGQFIGGIAHEMNNPLQSVLGHLELMLEDDHHATHRTELRRAFHDADRAAKIVRNLLVFSGSQPITRKRVSIDKVLARVIATREVALHRAAVTIDRVGMRDLPDVSGDSALLHQALLNVVVNAEQAIGEGKPGGRITITTAVEGTMVVVSIADNGGGITPDVLPRIFDPFFTTREVGQGTGLGLAISYAIIQEHGGTVTAHSAADGALFTIHLPLAE
jgi:two-component system, NtrC family, sensor kinase